MDMPVHIFRDPGIALGDQWAGCLGGGKALHSAQKVGRPSATIGAEGQRRVRQTIDQIHHLGRGDTHHRTSCRVEAHRAAPRHFGACKSFGSGAKLFWCADCFEPKHIRAPGLEPFGLFVEHLDGVGMRKGADRFHDFTSRADGAGHDDRSASGIGHLTTYLSPDAGQLEHPALRAV